LREYLLAAALNISAATAHIVSVLADRRTCGLRRAISAYRALEENISARAVELRWPCRRNLDLRGRRHNGAGVLSRICAMRGTATLNRRCVPNACSMLLSVRSAACRALLRKRLPRAPDATSAHSPSASFVFLYSSVLRGGRLRRRLPRRHIRTGKTISAPFIFAP